MASAKGVSLYLDAQSPGAPAFATHDLNQTTDALEFVFQAKTLEPITRLGFRQGALTGVAPVFRVSLQGANPANGFPDGSILASGAAFVDYTPTLGNNNAWQWVTLGSPYTPSVIGEQLALVIAYQSGTIDGSNHCTFTVSHNVAETPGMTYAVTNNAGTRTRAPASPCFGYGTADAVYGMPATAIISAAFFQSGERGFKFRLPRGWCQSFTLAGVRWNTSQNPGVMYRMRLYDEDGETVLQERTLDFDINQSASGGVRYHEVLFDEATLATLRTGVWYRVTRYVLNTPGGLSEHGFTVAAAADLEAWPLGGELIKARRELADMLWLDDPLSRPLVGLILGDLTASAPTGEDLEDDDPCSLRTLEIVRRWLSEDPGIVTTGVNLRDFSNDLVDVDKPAVYVIAAGQDGQELGRESDGGVREDLPILCAAWCKAPDINEDSEPVEPDVTTTRERLIRTIRARLAFEDTVPNIDGLSGAEPDSLAARLRYDRAQHGNGCEGFQETGPTIRDEGEAPPWGYAVLRFVARLHYTEGAF